MAFDGICVAALVSELNKNILGGRISKIAQPETDELLLTVKSAECGQKRLLISANASLPLICFTDTNKSSPITAPSFCMLLRKHISNGKIVSISQPGLERIINIRIEHLNEMGDQASKTLVIELMGKHSNIIFLSEEGIILDAIKHIPSSVSSLREVLPGREYFIPETSKKENPLDFSYETFKQCMQNGARPVYKALYSEFTGLSPFYSHELCFRAGIDGDESTEQLLLNENDVKSLFNALSDMGRQIQCEAFSPVILYENDTPFEFSALPVLSFGKGKVSSYESISSLIEDYYRQKALYSRMRTKSADLRHIVETILERDVKKLDLQLKQLKDTEKKDTFKIYGELLNTYGYGIEEGASSATVPNYYTGKDITIPLDPQKSFKENAVRYFEKYNKLKRTEEALTELIESVRAEIEYLHSLENALDIAICENDLLAIRTEMVEAGYIKRRAQDKGAKPKSKPLHYVTKEGFHIFVGKNNLQNEELTFKVANGNDWWFHAKKAPGSHVIVRTEGRELPDSVFEDAARLAAHYSKVGGSEKVEVDYVRRKEVKHPSGSKPGFVVYYTNFSMLIDSDISHLEQIMD